VVQSLTVPPVRTNGQHVLIVQTSDNLLFDFHLLRQLNDEENGALMETNTHDQHVAVLARVTS